MYIDRTVRSMIFGVGDQDSGRVAAAPDRVFVGEAFMAISRDQAARVLRQEAMETTTANGEAATGTSAALAGQLRSHVAEEGKRRTGEAPEKPVIEHPAPTASAPVAAASKPGKRKFVMMGVGLLLALAA